MKGDISNLLSKLNHGDRTLIAVSAGHTEFKR